MKNKIKNLNAKEILDSRNNPTILVLCELESGVIGEASVPSGKSTGQHEAVELRDLDQNRYNGKGVLKAVENVNTEILNALKGRDFDQSSLDRALINLDGTNNKSRLGANAILGVSLAFARACAFAENVPLYKYLGEISGNNDFKLPSPSLNILNGGLHADSGLDFQEFMIVPIGFKTFEEKINSAYTVIEKLKNILIARGYDTNLGDEGGFAPKLATNEEGLELLAEAIIESGFNFEQIKISLDIASSSFYKDRKYVLNKSGGEKNTDELIEMYQDLISKYPIISIEDPFAEEDWQGFKKLYQALGEKIMIVGDDLTVTNTTRIAKAIEDKVINTVLIKPNQIGTLTETINAIEMTKKANFTPFISHRSGETMDTFISDLAVGTNSPFIKSGSLTKDERLCKYKRLIEIEKSNNLN